MSNTDLALLMRALEQSLATVPYCKEVVAVRDELVKRAAEIDAANSAG